MTFEEFAVARLQAVLRFAGALTGDRALAEDVVQEVKIRAYLRWEHIDRMSLPELYVRKMVVNEFLSWRRRSWRIVPGPGADAPDQGTPDHAADHANRDAVLAALTTLPRRQRAVIVLRYYEGFTETEIAGMLGPAGHRPRLLRAGAGHLAGRARRPRAVRYGAHGLPGGTEVNIDDDLRAALAVLEGQAPDAERVLADVPRQARARRRRKTALVTGGVGAAAATATFAGLMAPAVTAPMAGPPSRHVAQPPHAARPGQPAASDAAALRSALLTAYAHADGSIAYSHLVYATGRQAVSDVQVWSYPAGRT